MGCLCLWHHEETGVDVMADVKAIFKKWWPTALTVVTAAVSFLDPAVQAWAKTHPDSSLTAMTIWMLILHHLPSPVTKEIK